MSKLYIKKNGLYYFRRRVPAHMKKYDSREFVSITLKTTDEVEAKRRAHNQNEMPMPLSDSQASEEHH